MAGGAGFVNSYVHDGTDALTRYLHEAEFAQRQDVMTGTVALHQLAHVFVELLTVLGRLHVDEIDNDDAAHVAQTKLAGKLFGSSKVDFQGVGLLTLLAVRTVAAVHIDHMQSFGVLDDEVGSVFVGNGSSEARFDLPRHVEVVEDGQRSLIELHHVAAFGGDEVDVVVNLVIDFFVVDVDVLEARVEEVAQHADGTACLFIDKHGKVFCLLHFAQDSFPAAYEHLHFGIKLAGTLAFGYCADDDAAVLGLEALYYLLQACPLGTALDFRRDGNLVAEWFEDEETTGEREVARQARTLRADRLFDYLHQHLLPLLQRGLHAPVLWQVGEHGSLLEGIEVLAVALHLLEVLGIGSELETQIEIMQEGIMLVTDVHEASIKPRHELAHLGKVHVAHGIGDILLLFLELSQSLVFGQRDGDFLRLYVNV